MNREIKFRAWDEINKEMVYPRIIKESFTSISSGDLLNRYEIVIQYTGLKDKNGVEIYEGDILKTGTGLAIVVWYNVSFALKSPASEAIDWEHSSFYEKSLVIGNIHENPELI